MFRRQNLAVGALNAGDYYTLAVDVVRTNARPSAVIEYVLKRQSNEFPEQIIGTEAQQILDTYLKKNLKVGSLIVEFGNIFSDDRWLGGPLESECLSKTYPDADIYTFAKSGARKDTALNFLRYVDFLQSPICQQNGYAKRTLGTLSDRQAQSLQQQLDVIKNVLEMDANRSTADNAPLPNDAFTEKVYQIGGTPVLNDKARKMAYGAAGMLAGAAALGQFM